MWLVEQATGDLADALDRDLRSDQLDFDDLGWRGLWAYITTAPPGTAIFHARIEGWELGDKIAAHQLLATQELVWRYTAMHFERGADQPFPQLISYPGSEGSEAPQEKPKTLEELVSPEVRALLQGT